MLNDDEIREWFNNQAAKNNTRDSNYSILERSFWDSEYTDAVADTISSQTRRTTSYKKIVNFLQTRVRDKVVISGEVPEVKMITPPDFNEEDLVQSEVDKMAIYDLWEHSNITWLGQNRFGYYSSLFGTCPILVLPDFENEKMIITTRHPQTMSAEADAAQNGEVALLGFSTQWTGSQLLASYPELSSLEIENTNEPNYKIHEFFDKNRRLFYVEGLSSDGSALWAKVPGLGIKHDLGFIPAQIYGNVISRDGVEGLSDVLHAMAIEENISEILALHNEALREAMDATLVVEDGANAKVESMPVGRGLKVNLPPGAKAYYLHKTTGAPAEVTNHIGMLTQFFKDTSGLPGVRLGQSPTSSVGTGKQVANLMSMTTDDVNAYRMGLGNALVGINEKGLKVLKQLFPDKKQEVASSLNPSQKLRSYHADMISKFPKHILKYNPMGFEAESIRMGTLQLLGQKVIDPRTARELLPGLNADEIERRIEFYEKKEMEKQKAMMDMQTEQQMMMQEMQQQQQPGMPGMPGQGAPQMLPAGEEYEAEIPEAPPELMEAI